MNIDKNKSVIENWKSADHIIHDILKYSCDSKQPIVKTILAMQDSSNLSITKIRLRAEKFVNKIDNYEINLFSLFLIIWTTKVISFNLLVEAEKLVSRIDLIKKNLVCNEISTYFLVVKSFYYSSLGDKENREVNLLKAITYSNNNVNIKFREKILNQYYGFLSNHGRLNEGLDKFKSKELSISKLDGIQRLFFQYVNAINNVNMDEAQDHFKEIKHHIQYDNIAFQELIKQNESLHFYNILTAWKNNKTYSEIVINNNPTYKSIKSLLLNKPKEALFWAREAVIILKSNIHSSSLHVYVLIRAEIANNNANAAINLLNSKIASGNSHFLDDFFYTRAYLLQGKEKSAIHNYNRLLKNALKLNAIARIEFELDLSCELSKGHLHSFLTNIFSTNLQNRKGPTSTKLNYKNNQKSKDNVGIKRLIGNSKEIEIVKKSIKQYAKIDSIILITGETGVGKEEVAKAIHEESDRKSEPFIAINCAAIVDSLLQSELFGHKAGSYTGANQTHKGIFESAGKGTVLLDEIGDISPLLQVTLLRVLECGEFRSIGNTKSTPYYCRIILATNKNLMKISEEKLFRKDLYYRLNKFEIKIPALRDRAGDIPYLAKYFHQLNHHNKNKISLSQSLLDKMNQYSWPGNIRELRHEVERMRMLNSQKLSYEKEDFTINTESITHYNNNESTKSGETLKVASEKEESLTTEDKLILNDQNKYRRIERLKILFKKHNRLTRSEIIKAFQISSSTASTYLKLLIDENYIIKITPNSSPRSAYFILK
ncbi:MAG: hypothetical protein COA79_21850 [Planctomycetota bacterium]|nr:MAG: hypothetical protein COA79_21850 [Planctomycetota bacterium]